MLIGVNWATTKIAAIATRTLDPPTTSGTPGRDQRSEDDQQRQGREGQRDDLASLEVALADVLHVTVERRPAGELDSQARRVTQALTEDRQGVGRVVRGQVEQHDVVCRVAVGRDLARLEQVRHDADHVRSRWDVAHRRSGRGLELGPAGRERVGVERPPPGRTAATPSSCSRRALARADSRSSRMKPPARRASGACGAKGNASRISAAHTATTRRARRTTKRPSRSKGPIAAIVCGARIGAVVAHRSTGMPSASIAGRCSCSSWPSSSPSRSASAPP